MAVFYRYQDAGLDDWERNKNHVQMGFRPGFAVQARELTQMQTILQAQITALARRFMKNGSIVDANLTVNGPVGGGSGNWSVILGSGYVYCEPDMREVGYFVRNNSSASLSAIPIETGTRTNVYFRFQEKQINGEGNSFPAQGGYAEVDIDSSILDNAQGYANASAPGASRYQINIIGLGYYRPDLGEEKPVYSADMIYFENGIPRYSDSGDSVPFN